MLGLLLVLLEGRSFIWFWKGPMKHFFMLLMPLRGSATGIVVALFLWIRENVLAVYLSIIT